MAVAYPLDKSPAKPSLQQLNAEALGGDFQACVLLADNSQGLTFREFVDRYVPEGELNVRLPDRKDGRSCVFDIYYDAFAKSRAKSKET